MINKSGFSLDWKEFDRTFFPLVDRKIPDAGAEGLFNAAGEMLDDGDNEAPQAPFEFGDLRGAGQIEDPVFSLGKITVEVGYNMAYAAKLHESAPGEFNFVPRRNILNPGRKWLSTKMIKYKEKYMRIVVWTIDDLRT